MVAVAVAEEAERRDRDQRVMRRVLKRRFVPFARQNESWLEFVCVLASYRRAVRGPFDSVAQGSLCRVHPIVSSHRRFRELPPVWKRVSDRFAT